MGEYNISIFGAIYVFGVIQGVIHVSILYFDERYSTPSNKYIILLILACLNINIIGIIYEFNLFDSAYKLWIYPVSFFPLIAPATYFSIQFIIKRNYKIKRWEYALYLPFIMSITHQLFTTYYYSGPVNNVSETHFMINFRIELMLEMLTAVVFLLVFIKVIFQIKKYEDELKNQLSYLDDRSLQWIINTIIFGCILTTIWSITIYLEFLYGPLHDPGPVVPTGQEKIVWIGASVLVYWISYGLIIRPEIFNSYYQNVHLIKQNHDLAIQNTNEDHLETISKLSDKTNEYHKQIVYLISEKALYRNPDFNMDQLAKEINLSKGYLSQIINVIEKKNFFEFVNDYRIADVKEKLANKSFDHFSIVAIAMESGFKSKSSFYNVFKKATGITPSEFRKKARKQ
ncbi:MAG: helix-turn-helix domain-containing protein [Saprospiraceae bacterium]